jgi:hypothetical protein
VFVSIIKEWCWVGAILICCYAVHLNAIHHKMQVVSQIQTTVAFLKEQKSRALDLQNELKLRIQSQDDPEWIAMMLMKGLGVVPSGQTKVHFEEIE